MNKPPIVRAGWALLSSLGLVCSLSACDASGYRQRGGGWSHDGDRIAPLAPDSFRPIDRLLAHDALHGHYRGSVVDGSHGPSFEALSAYEARDRDTRRVYDEGVPFDVRDSSTFEPLDGGFGRDRARGYYAHAEIPGSDGATFATVGADDASYVRDRQRVWYGSIDVDRPNERPRPVVRLLCDADPPSPSVARRSS